jgi:hypothetical protein
VKRSEPPVSTTANELDSGRSARSCNVKEASFLRLLRGESLEALPASANVDVVLECSCASVMASDDDSSSAFSRVIRGCVVVNAGTAAGVKNERAKCGRWTSVLPACEQKKRVRVIESLIEPPFGGVTDAKNLLTADVAKRCDGGVMLGAGLPSVRVGLVELFVPAEFRDVREEESKRLVLVGNGKDWWCLGWLEVWNAKIWPARISNSGAETEQHTYD